MVEDFILKNGKLALPNGVIKANLAINDGKISGIYKSSSLEANREIDLNDKLVLPGGLDFHVHMMDMGYSDREDWISGSKSAAAGGTTFVVDFGHTDPPSTTKNNFIKIKDKAEKNSLIDFRINGAITSKNIGELGSLVEEGVSVFGEIYMAESIPELERIDDGKLWEAFQEISELNTIAGVHAENWGIVKQSTEKLKDEGRRDPEAHPESRPAIAEEEAISKAILFSKRADVPLHIYHLSSEDGLNVIKENKDCNIDLTSEVCVHHLLFNKEDMEDLGPYIKANPPIRSKKDQESLWKGVKNGTIDMISTDHWPLPKSNKEKGWENIWEAGAGVPGLETRIPLILTFGVEENRISIKKFVELISENPAKRLGLYPKKGALAVGSDADITVVNLDDTMEIKAEEMFSKCDQTPYEGWEVTGIPELTMVRGEIIMENREIIGEPGYGEFH